MDIRLNGSNPSRQTAPKTQAPEGEKPKKSLPRLNWDSLALTKSTGKTYTPPEESTWFKVKKKVALALSGVDIQHTRALTKEQAQAVTPQMKPGDVLLRRTDYTSANMVIPGFYGHAAVYVGNGKIIDATTHGVREVSVEQFFQEGDHALVMRPKNLSDDQSKKIVQYAQDQLGKVYDYDLDVKDDRRFTCTELVYSALKAGTSKEFAQENLLGGISPDKFRNQNFEVIWSSTPEESSLDS